MLTARTTSLTLALALLTACGPAAPTAPTAVLPNPEVQACATAAATPAVVTVNTASIRVVAYRWCAPGTQLNTATVEFSRTIFTREADFDAFRTDYIACEKNNSGTDVCVRQFSARPGVTFRSVPIV